MSLRRRRHECRVYVVASSWTGSWTADVDPQNCRKFAKLAIGWGGAASFTLLTIFIVTGGSCLLNGAGF